MNVWQTMGLQLLFVLFVAGAGEACAGVLCRRLGLEARWLERLCLGAVIVVTALALLGWLVAAMPWSARRPVGITAIALLTVASAWVLLRGGWRGARSALPAERLYAAGYVVLCIGTLVLALWPVRLPTSLPDGAYVAKADLLPVRVQFSTGNMPADNAIPHVVSEYLLRDISFRAERPILPGQEVTNRPILAALTYLPFRAAFRMPDAWTGVFPRFSYVGTMWPDFSALLRDEGAYRVSQAIGICLNALLLLGAGAFALRVGPPAPAIAVAVLGIALSSPYVLFQTYFTWPKALAGFFLVVAWLAAVHWRRSLLVGAVVGLAYLSHPYAIVFACAHLGWLAWRGWRGDPASAPAARGAIGEALRFIAAFALVTAPWFIWSKWILSIPTDLVEQNFRQPGQALRDFLWVRPVNLLHTFLPVHLLQYPYEVVGLVRASAINFAGAVGLVALAALVHRACVGRDLQRAETLWLWIVPSLLLVLVFSNLALPALHGLQPLVAVGIAAAVIHLWNALSRRAWLALWTGQMLVNALMLLRYLKKLG